METMDKIKDIKMGCWDRCGVVCCLVFGPCWSLGGEDVDHQDRCKCEMSKTQFIAKKKHVFIY
jgi:hypothetical protein